MSRRKRENEGGERGHRTVEVTMRTKKAGRPIARRHIVTVLMALIIRGVEVIVQGVTKSERRRD